VLPALLSSVLGRSVAAARDRPLAQPKGCRLLATTHMLKYCEFAP
jgi:hypothetical protein